MPEKTVGILTSAAHPTVSLLTEVGGEIGFGPASFKKCKWDEDELKVTFELGKNWGWSDDSTPTILQGYSEMILLEALRRVAEADAA